MTDDTMDQIRDANPFPSELPAPPIEEVWRRVEANPGPGLWTGHDSKDSSPGASGSERFGGAQRRGGHARLAGFLVPAVSLLVVAIVAISFFGIHGSSPRGKTASGGLVELVYEALPNPPGSAVTRGTLERTVEIMQARLRVLGVAPGVQVSVTGTTEITVRLPNGTDTARAEREIGIIDQLSVYDWEANVLAPNGKTVASQLQERNPTALKISQGSGSLAPGSSGAGSIGLYQAVLLASEQPENANPANSRVGQQYFMFGAPGTAACQAAAKANGTVPTAGQHCLLSGPADDRSDLLSGLPAGVSTSEGQILTVPRGTVVLQAISSSSAPPVAFSDNDPSAQFFVLKDNVALRGSDITNPQPSTDPNSRKPDITFGVTSKGKTAFQSMTAVVARRGDQLSGPGQTLNQHFAVAFDSQLIAVPYIDYKIYPHGVTAYGADLSSGLTAASTRSLATALRLGALPLNLKLICRAPAATACHMPSVR